MIKIYFNLYTRLISLLPLVQNYDKNHHQKTCKYMHLGLQFSLKFYNIGIKN